MLTKADKRKIAEFDMAERRYHILPSGRLTHKTQRYNWIERRPGRNPRTREVTVVHVAVRLTRAGKPQVKDVVRIHMTNDTIEARDIAYHGLGGWVVYWDAYDWQYKIYHARFVTGEAGEWAKVRYKRGGAFLFPWHRTINPEALKGTRYEYCQYTDEIPCGLVDWLKLYRKEPKIELLAKMGLHKLASPAGLAAMRDRRIFDWVRAHAEQIRRSKGTRLREIIWAARRDYSLAAARQHFDFVTSMSRFRRWTPRNLPRSVKLDYERIAELLGKWRVTGAEYMRYLEYARDAGLDLRNEGTLYPPTKGGRNAFMQRLENLEAEIAKRKRRERRMEAARVAKLMSVRLDEIAAFQRSFARATTLKGCGYRIVLAKSQKELLAEGRKMNNCVGCGTYGTGIVEGDCLIVMLRDRSGRPYCDIEINRKTWTIRQCYLKHNQTPPAEVQELAKKIALVLRDEWRRMRKARKAA